MEIIGSLYFALAIPNWMSTGKFGYFGKIGTIVVSLKGSYNFNIEENGLFIGLFYSL